MVIKEELIKIVGKENILDDAGILGEYSRDQSFVMPVKPRCVVKPKSVEEVQDIVKWANDTSTPLVPISSGPPRFRGDTVPSVGGAVIIELSRMKKIMRIDRRHRVCMVESGVTFGELIPELEKEDLAPFMPLLPRSTKSVVASLLEREPMTTPYYHWGAKDPLICTEVVYGSGDFFRTGSAVGPGTLEQQWEAGRAQIRGLGPAVANFAQMLQGAQGTMGVVTWANIVCKILPKANSAFFVPSDNVDQLIDLTYRIMWKKLDTACLIMNDHNLASILGENAEEIRELQEILPHWVLFINLEAGGLLPEEKVEYQEVEFMEAAQMFGLKPVKKFSRANAEVLAGKISRPSEEPYWKLRPKGGCHDVFFVTTLDKTPEFTTKMCELAETYRYPSTDMGVYLQPILRGTSCHCEFNLSYDPQSEEEMEKVNRLVTEGCRALSNMGGYFSRPYGPWADIVMGNTAGTMKGLRKIKKIFDPNDIMNPGKLNL